MCNSHLLGRFRFPPSNWPEKLKINLFSLIQGVGVHLFSIQSVHSQTSPNMLVAKNDLHYIGKLILDQLVRNVPVTCRCLQGVSV